MKVWEMLLLCVETRHCLQERVERATMCSETEYYLLDWVEGTATCEINGETNRNRLWILRVPLTVGLWMFQVSKSNWTLHFWEALIGLVLR